MSDVEPSDTPSEPVDVQEPKTTPKRRRTSRQANQPPEEELPAAEAPSLDSGPAESGGWPWDIASDPDSAPPLAALDDPGADSESMIRAMADDDASRTVVFGEYAVDEVKGSEPFLDAAKRAAADESAAEQAPEPEPESEADPRRKTTKLALRRLTPRRAEVARHARGARGLRLRGSR